ncbi:MAG: exonuclease domain-containing protein [Psychromonas sp.]
MLRFFKKTDLLRELKEKRIACLQYALPNAIKDNLSQPLPDKNTPFRALSFLVVDFETTGLEADTSDILSMGWIEISNMQVDCASQRHFYINNDKYINHETAVINHIVPQMVHHGVNLAEAIDILLDHAKDKILVVHGKVIEKNFLDCYAQKNLQLPELPLIWIDTMNIEGWRTMNMEAKIDQDTRLSSVRKRYNLPQYSAHNALIDSIATAELLLAQVANIYRDRNVTFEQLYGISQ